MTCINMPEENSLLLTVVSHHIRSIFTVSTVAACMHEHEITITASKLNTL